MLYVQIDPSLCFSIHCMPAFEISSIANILGAWISCMTVVMQSKAVVYTV